MSGNFLSAEWCMRRFIKTVNDSHCSYCCCFSLLLLIVTRSHRRVKQIHTHTQAQSHTHTAPQLASPLPVLNASACPFHSGGQTFSFLFFTLLCSFLWHCLVCLSGCLFFSARFFASVRSAARTRLFVIMQDHCWRRRWPLATAACCPAAHPPPSNSSTTLLCVQTFSGPKKKIKNLSSHQLVRPAWHKQQQQQCAHKS